jgi:hypothetical protein
VDDGEVVEATLVPDRKPLRKDWMLRSGVTDEEFAWIAVDSEPRCLRSVSRSNSGSSTSSPIVEEGQQAVEETITERVVEDVYRAPPRPPAVEAVIVPQKKPSLEASAVDFGYSRLFGGISTDASIELHAGDGKSRGAADSLEERNSVAESPESNLELLRSPPSYPPPPPPKNLSAGTENNYEAEENVGGSVAIVSVTVRRLDEMLATSKIEFEAVEQRDKTWAAAAAASLVEDERRRTTADEPVSVTVSEPPRFVPISKPPLGPLEEEPTSVDVAAAVRESANICVETPEKDDDSVEYRRTKGNLSPSVQLSIGAGIDVEGEIAATPPSSEAAAEGLRVSEKGNSGGGSLSEDQKNIQSTGSGGGGEKAGSGGVFGFLRRKPAKNSGKDDISSFEERHEFRNKSSSLGKKQNGNGEGAFTQDSRSTTEIGGGGGTFPMEAKKENKNKERGGGGSDRGGHFRMGLNFGFSGSGSGKDRGSGTGGSDVIVPPCPAVAAGADLESDEEAAALVGTPKKQSRPGSATTAAAAAKSPASKTNIRIFEIMASSSSGSQPQLNGTSSTSAAVTADGAGPAATGAADIKAVAAGSKLHAPQTADATGKQLFPLVDTRMESGTGGTTTQMKSVEPSSPSLQLVGEVGSAGGRVTVPSIGVSDPAVDAAGPDRRSASRQQPSTTSNVGRNVDAAAAVTTSNPQGVATIPYIVAVAIDFGTTFSGYAFSFTHDNASRDSADGRAGGVSVHMMGKWEGGDPGLVNQKTPSTLLLTPDGQFHSFGFTARNYYHDLTADDADRWLYFDKFKMSLYDAKDCNVDTTLIRAANGRQFSAFRAVAMTLGFFKQHALAELNEQCGTRILDDDVRWVITVPAIWNAQAKHFMRLAAYEAGIASPANPGQLLIALEPEAASLHIRRLRIHQLVPDKPIRRPLSIRQETYNDGEGPADVERVAHKFTQRVTRYMVVDCGGGTVDVTVHELDSIDERLRELHKAAGGPHGSCGIDAEFHRLLRSIFGDEFVESFKRRYPSGWVCLMSAFESRKRAADPYRTTATSLNVPLPFSFIHFYHKQTGSSVETAISKYGDKDIRWSSQGMLRLTQDAMKKLFQPTLDSIAQTVAEVLEHPRLKDVQYIFLVGGLSESPVVQQEMRQRFGANVQVLVPQEASLAVLKGAVCFGLDQTIVAVRRSRYTYGAAVLKRFVRGLHPESKLLKRATTAADGGGGGSCTEWCRDVFDPYVVVDQVVRVGDVVVRRYAPASPSQTFITIAIYCSSDPAPVFTTDNGVTKCATIRLDLSSVGTMKTVAGQVTTRVIETRMTFADTEIKVAAIDVSTGQQVTASLDFFNE